MDTDLFAAIADARGVSVGRHYTAKETATLFKVSLTTIHRWRTTGRLVGSEIGPGRYEYLGYDIVNCLFRSRRCQDTNHQSATGTANGGLTKDLAAPPGIDAGSIPKHARWSELASARRALKKP